MNQLSLQIVINMVNLIFMRKIFFVFVLIHSMFLNKFWAQSSSRLKETSVLYDAVVNKEDPVVDPPLTKNSLQFDYDVHGNQIRRRLIYLAAPSSNAAQTSTAAVNKFESSDLYDDVSYYPNPVLDILSVKWQNHNGNSVNNLQLYNISGQLIRQFDNMKDVETTEVSFQEYPTGLYELVLVYSNGDQKTLKIVKR